MSDTAVEPEDDEQAAKEWLEASTAHIWLTWGKRYPDGRDW